MATTSKKTPKKSPPKPRATSAAASIVKLKKTIAAQALEIRQGAEQQAATSEILQMIAKAPDDLQSLLDMIAERAARLCDSIDAQIVRLYDDGHGVIASYGPLAVNPRQEHVPLDRGTVAGRSVIDRQTIHVPDLLNAPASEYPRARELAQRHGNRTILATPLLRQGVPVGAILIRRLEVRPFSDNQIKLLETFADQAVIAIENARLFEESQERNRDLTEALEQQTATSEILGVIASSPTDIQPVLDTVAESAARLCEATDAQINRLEGDALRRVASYGSMPTPYNLGEASPVSRGHVGGRAVIDRQTIHIHDITAEFDNEFPQSKTLQSRTGARTILATPLLREGDPIGVIVIRRSEVRSFTDKQIALLKTFADQAVIAIENVRLFQELKEALEQQTATSEILGVIASSPTDIQPVLNVIAENAARICGTPDVAIFRVEDDGYRVVATYGSAPVQAAGETRPLDRGSVVGRAMVERQTIHIHDVRAVQDDFWRIKTGAVQEGLRTMLAIPLLRENVAIGAIVMRRTEVHPFNDKQITLLKTFADQAVIAIENVRLFKELGERNAELREALEHQTATAEVLGIISRSPTDVQPVLDAIVESAARVCGIDDVVLRLREENSFVSRAHFGPLAINRVEISIDEPQFSWMREHGTLHIPDASDQSDSRMVVTGGWRTFLVVPLRQQGELIGGLFARRIDVRPFTPAQIKLLETFADQAVIAIENVRLFQELKEALEQQTATSEILGVIASSPTDIQPVLDVVAENAARLCEASDTAIWRSDGANFWLVASQGSIPVPLSEGSRPLTRSIPSARAMIDRETVHIHDLLSPDSLAEFSEAVRSGGIRTVLVAPLLREGLAIGAIHVRRPEVRPFTDKQIALLKTFADQAVIAIENVRLFQELGERNAELREALEHQTATAEVLGIISRSPTDVQPVLDAIVESAAKVCGIDDVLLRLQEGNSFVARAHFGSIPISYDALSINEPYYRWIREHGTLHVPDVRAQNDFPTLGLAVGWRTYLGAPLHQQGQLVGLLNARRMEVRPFTPAQIKLLETFADQAVIAIENVRLFQELKESLEQQTATSEILGVIASSPTDIQPVLDTVAATAARLCDSTDAQLRLIDGRVLRLAASYGPLPVPEIIPITRQTVSGRAVTDRQVIHVHDLEPEREAEYPEGARDGSRTILGMPLLRESFPIGSILIRRLQVQPFSDKQIALLKTFADQAVIAIENVRLFKELGERNAELREALEHQTATAEVLGIISRSPTDVQPVLDAIVESAARVCGIDDLVLRLHEGNSLVSRAHFGSIPVPIGRAEISMDDLQYRWMREHGTLHIPDVSKWTDFQVINISGWRSFLAVPLRQQGELIGGMTARRIEVRPFTPAQIKLLETFADQAVIAIENVRLFQELTEALEQQTATSDILGVISSSPTDLQPVFDTIAEHSAQALWRALRFGLPVRRRADPYGSR